MTFKDDSEWLTLGQAARKDIVPKPERNLFSHALNRCINLHFVKPIQMVGSLFTFGLGP